MIPQSKIDALIDRFEKVEAQMSSVTDSDEIIRLSKEHGELKEIVEKGARVAVGAQAAC